MIEKVLVGLFVIAFTLFIALLMSVFVYFGWNNTMPAIFGLTKITLWQAFWLAVLAGCLFKDTTGSKK